MITQPILPIWFMAIICVIMLLMKRKGIINYIRQILIVILLFVINLRPMIPFEMDEGDFVRDVDVLFVIDNTISMLAEDYDGDGRRIDAVKEDCNYIIEKIPGASFSIMTFDDELEVKIPYTTDTNIVRQTLSVLQGQTKLYASGTSVENALDGLEDYLDNERETYQIVFFISDGEITTGEDLGRHSDLEEYVDAGAVMGYGTEEGGKMQVIWYPGDTDRPEYLTYYDRNYDEVVARSVIDEENLEEIASDLGVEYVHMTRQSRINDVLDAIEEEINMYGDDKQEDIVGSDREYYFYLAIPLAILLVIDFVYYRRKVFRKGQ